MIRYEIVEDKPWLKVTYSNTGKKIMNVDTGAIYDTAYDPIESTNVYRETDINIKDCDEEPELP